LVSVATELESYIDEKNKELKAAITSQDLDDPDYHDYQTCLELMKLSSKITKLESKAQRKTHRKLVQFKDY